MSVKILAAIIVFMLAFGIAKGCAKDWSKSIDVINNHKRYHWMEV